MFGRCRQISETGNRRSSLRRIAGLVDGTCLALVVVLANASIFAPTGDAQRLPSRLIRAAERLVETRGSEEIEILNGITGLRHPGVGTRAAISGSGGAR
ncbi:MAG: hypothetical protein KDJ16_07655 [Hyphomicrobiales bacterium]|nr:hypothetical protein [Hyphomicrobiales bacterium]